MPLLTPINLNEGEKELVSVVRSVLARTQHPDLIPTYDEVCCNLDKAGMTIDATFQNLSDLMFNAQNSSTRLRATKVALDMRKIDQNKDKVEGSLTINFNFESGSDNKIQSIFSPRAS